MACCPIKGTPPKDEYFNSLSVKNAYICNLCVGNIKDFAQLASVLNVGASVYSSFESPLPPGGVALQTYTMNGVPEVIPFDAIDFDTSNMYDLMTHRFTIPSSGQYNLNLVVCWQGEAMNDWLFTAGFRLYQSGSIAPTLFVGKIQSVVSLAFPFSGTTSITMNFEKGDEIEPISFVNDLGTGDITKILLFGTFEAQPSIPVARVSVASVHKI